MDDDCFGLHVVALRNAVAAKLGLTWDSARGDSISGNGPYTLTIDGIGYTVTVEQDQTAVE